VHPQVNASTLQQAAALLTAADKRLSQQEVAADLIVAGNAKNYGYHQRRRALQELLRLLRDTVSDARGCLWCVHDASACGQYPRKPPVAGSGVQHMMHYQHKCINRCEGQHQWCEPDTWSCRRSIPHLLRSKCGMPLMPDASAAVAGALNGV
jgi:hypothetical protein